MNTNSNNSMYKFDDEKEELDEYSIIIWRFWEKTLAAIK